MDPGMLLPGSSRTRIQVALSNLGASACLDSALKLCPDDAVVDLSALFEATLRVLPDFESALPNPIFAQSTALGGADADVVLDDLLLDAKVTTRRLDRPAFFQLFGYLLADTNDELGIRRIGLLLPRIPTLVQWSADEALACASSAPRRELKAWREEFATVVQGVAEERNGASPVERRIRMSVTFERQDRVARGGESPERKPEERHRPHRTDR